MTIIFVVFAKKIQKNDCVFDLLSKNHTISKKNWSNQSSDEGDIVDLKSTIF